MVALEILNLLHYEHEQKPSIIIFDNGIWIMFDLVHHFAVKLHTNSNKMRRGNFKLSFFSLFMAKHFQTMQVLSLPRVFYFSNILAETLGCKFFCMLTLYA
jgi:hypothetical protein